MPSQYTLLKLTVNMGDHHFSAIKPHYKLGLASEWNGYTQGHAWVDAET